MLLGNAILAADSPYLYGIFGYDPSSGDNPADYISHVTSAGPAWVTISAAIGHDTNDASGLDNYFNFPDVLRGSGAVLICRLNNGYFPNGTIPLTNQYDAFATRCSNFVAHSHFCSIWTIGNELNVQGEWPYNPVTGKMDYVSPSNYATCFRKVYNAIKAVHPNDKVLPEGPAAGQGGGPANAGSIGSYTGTNYNAVAQPLNWIQHLNQFLTAITNIGPNPKPPDGIVLHIPSQGYNCTDIHSTATFTAAGQTLYQNFYVYRDAVNLGIPPGLKNLPLYATECNGNQSWNNYQPGWVQEIYAEINRYNQWAFSTNGPVFRCVNFYRWCCGDASQWWINGNVNEGQILSDLDQAVAQRYVWPASLASVLVPVGFNFIDPGGSDDSVAVCDFAGVVPINSWNNLTTGGNGTLAVGGGISITWASPGGTHSLPIANSPGDYNLMQGYLDTSSTSTTTATVSGLKFLLYDALVYCDGDNGGATRVGKYTLSGASSGNTTKYVRDDAGAIFNGTYTESDSTTPGLSAAPGNYCRFRNIRGSSFSIAAKGDYASDGNPRAALNALQIVPVNVVPSISDPSYGAGQFQFFLNGATNANYIIQASTNLTSWTPIKTNPAPAQITVSGSLPFRYYRALFQ